MKSVIYVIWLYSYWAHYITTLCKVQETEDNTTPGGVVATGEVVEAIINRNNANAIECHGL